MKEYTVNIAEKALADMAAIYTHIAVSLEAPETARAEYEFIASRIRTLSQFPERYRLFDADPERALGMRRILIGHYSAVYVVKERSVTVLRALYGASGILTRLKSRSNR